MFFHIIHTPIVYSSWFHKRPVTSDFSILNQNLSPRELDAFPFIRHIKLSMILQTSSTQDLAAVIPITPPPRRAQVSFFAAICIQFIKKQTESASLGIWILASRAEHRRSLGSVVSKSTQKQSAKKMFYNILSFMTRPKRCSKVFFRSSPQTSEGPHPRLLARVWAWLGVTGTVWVQVGLARAGGGIGQVQVGTWLGVRL
jgi:hypothetical protein